MELFVVKNKAGKQLQSFNNKPAAKEYRDTLGGIEAGFHVSRGKDNKPSPKPHSRRGGK